jgi:DNA-3-methyladenine glycosylase
VARELLGHLLVHRFEGQDLILRIVETEAYLGLGDRASHAWRGRPTLRTKVLFGPGGIAYVYLVYGLHDMFNVVTGEEGDGSAVLVRSGVPVAGEQRMKENRGLVGRISAGDIAGGPGKLCQALQIDRDLNGTRLDRGELQICRGQSIVPGSVVTGPRVGVDYAGAAAGWPLRYAESGNPHVSRPSPG